MKTPVTDILDQASTTPAKEKRDQTKEHTRKEAPKATNPAKEKRDQTKPSQTIAHLARRPDHEQPSKLPSDLKRPDLDAIVDGNKIASEAQRQLYDDIKRGNCTRCHKGEHIRKDCKEPKTKWEEKFDKEKLQYWDSVVKWQARATTGAKPPLFTLNPSSSSRLPRLRTSPSIAPLLSRLTQTRKTTLATPPSTTG